MVQAQYYCYYKNDYRMEGNRMECNTLQPAMFKCIIPQYIMQ